MKQLSRLTEAAKEFACPGEQRRRLLMTVLGVVVCAISVAFFRQAAFGTDPFQCMCGGLDMAVPLDFGTLYMLINAVMLVAMVALDRHYIGLGTLINLFLYGYIVEFSEGVIFSVFGAPTLALRIGYITFALVVLCIGSALYFTADLGVSTYDFVALSLAKRQDKVPFKVIRIFTDLICVGIGLIFGCKPGVGTLITAFCMGPLIAFFNVRIAEPMRYGKKK